MASSNPLTRLLDSNKLTGTENFHDWELNLKLILESEKLSYVVDNPLPIDIDPTSNPEEHVTFNKWKDDNLKVKSYMLGSVSTDLLHQYIGVPNAYSIMNTIGKLFGANMGIEIYRRSKELFQSNLKEGSSVSPHVLGIIDRI